MAEKAIKKLTLAQKEKVKVITGHYLPFGIHEYFKNRTPVYITIVRDPYKRARSFYNYYRTMYEKEKSTGKNKIIYRSFLKVDGKIVDFDTWIRKKYGTGKSGLVTQPMSKYYKDLGYKLSDFYFIGITKELNTDLSFLFHLLGVNKYFVNQNISQDYIGGDRLKAKYFFSKKYAGSMKIFQKAIESNRIFKKKYPDWDSVIGKISFRRKLLTPFTQIIFDFVESLRMLSSVLRKSSKLYGRVLDFLKDGLF